jgi:2-oxoglutarate ferredoxin oxidoreductase subunit alpha
MSEQDLNWLIGGPQGSGINLSAETFAKACTRAGYRVFASIEYHSNIMGEHSYERVRISTEDRGSALDAVHVMVALDAETIVGPHHGEFPEHNGHLHELVPGGGLVYDAAIKLDTAHLERDDVRLYAVPFDVLLRQTLREFDAESQAGRLRVMTNTIAVGASLALMGFATDCFAEVIQEGFSGRRKAVGEMNGRAAAVGAEFIRQNFPDAFPFTLPKVAPPARTPLLIRGMHAAAIAKLQAGLTFQSYYPISPATDENVYLETQQRNYDLLVVQTEDEISAINMAVGAAHVGARASTSTSGPGLALMVEGLGFAAMTEAPGPVLILWQRGGPSTGLPTRQEQADLRFALQPGQGEFPSIVVAPGDVPQTAEDCFEAFNWADRYQVPVIVLVDKLLSSAFWTLDELSFEGWQIDRGPLAALPPLRDIGGNGHSANGNGSAVAKTADYLRYALVEGGVTPRALPGQEGGVFWSTTDEHDPRGHITENAQNRIDMMHKRMGKLDRAIAEIPADRKVRLYGPPDAEYTLVGWGTTKGAILDALAELEVSGGPRCNFLQVRLMRPFPVAEVQAALQGKQAILVENNYMGQLGLLIREQTGIDLPLKVLKFDGRPFSQEEMVEGLRQAFGQREGRVAVTHLSA